MAIPIQLRRGTATLWATVNPTLAVGELGLETDTAKFKIGNGSAAWTSLAYAFEGIGVSDAAYDAATWNGVTTVAPSKNAVRDKIETMVDIASPQSITGTKTFASGGGFTVGSLATVTLNTGIIWNYVATAAAEHRLALGIPTYANLTAANAVLAIGQVYFDTALGTLNTATA